MKVAVGVGKGKQTFDKRDDLKKRDDDREMNGDDDEEGKVKARMED